MYRNATCVTVLPKGATPYCFQGYESGIRVFYAQKKGDNFEKEEKAKVLTNSDEKTAFKREVWISSFCSLNPSGLCYLDRTVGLAPMRSNSGDIFAVEEDHVEG